MGFSAGSCFYGPVLCSLALNLLVALPHPICQAPRNPPHPPHHDRKDDSSHGGLKDPEQGQAEDLHQGEQVDPAKGHVPQEGVVRLVLGWHEEQLTAFPELARI